MLQQILMAALEQQSGGREVGCEEVKHPQTSSELISYDNRTPAFGFYNVFAYQEEKANFIYKTRLISMKDFNALFYNIKPQARY